MHTPTLDWIDSSSSSSIYNATTQFVCADDHIATYTLALDILRLKSLFTQQSP